MPDRAANLMALGQRAGGACCSPASSSISGLNPETRFDAATGLASALGCARRQTPRALLGGRGIRSRQDLPRCPRDGGVGHWISRSSTPAPPARTRCPAFAPVMLNALLARFAARRRLARGFRGTGRRAGALHRPAEDRRASIDRHLWDEEAGYYRSLHLETRQLATAASVSPPSRRCSPASRRRTRRSA